MTPDDLPDLSDLPDPLTALRAEIDQALALSAELARSARGLFDAFKAEGFTDAQACYLTAVQLTGSPGSP